MHNARTLSPPFTHEMQLRSARRRSRTARVHHAAPVIIALGVLFASGCRKRERPPSPTFAELFPPVGGRLQTESSPSLADLDGDGVPDIVFGTGVDRVRPKGPNLQFTGEPVVSGEVVAVSGATNRVLWEVPNPRDAFTTPRFVDLNRDRVLDVVMGGREGILTAYDGPTGKVIWRLNGDNVVHTSFPYYFMTPAVIPDVNGDGVPDLIDDYGGDDTKNPGEPRQTGYLMIVSGADGKVLKMEPMPDRAETYTSPVVYHRKDGAAWVVFGSGGESLPGAEYRAPVASLLDGTFAAKVERLVPPGTKKGVIAPPTILDLNHDGEPDIVVSTFDGRVVAIDGASGKPLWQQTYDNEETYHSAAVVRIGEGHLGLFVSHGIGAFPRYVGTVHRLYDAADGRVLYEFRDPNRPGGAPLAVDLTGDGVDEAIFFAISFPAGQASRVYVVDFVSHTRISHDVPANLWSTPLVADVRNTGKLELIALTWLAGKAGGTMALPDVFWSLVRLDLSAKTPPSLTWAGYMGTAHDGVFTER
jgi:outer membrane protein assembly factor BamB